MKEFRKDLRSQLNDQNYAWPTVDYWKPSDVKLRLCYGLAKDFVDENRVVIRDGRPDQHPHNRRPTAPTAPTIPAHQADGVAGVPVPPSGQSAPARQVTRAGGLAEHPGNSSASILQNTSSSVVQPMNRVAQRHPNDSTPASRVLITLSPDASTAASHGGELSAQSQPRSSDSAVTRKVNPVAALPKRHFNLSKTSLSATAGLGQHIHEDVPVQPANEASVRVEQEEHDTQSFIKTKTDLKTTSPSSGTGGGVPTAGTPTGVRDDMAGFAVEFDGQQNLNKQSKSLHESVPGVKSEEVRDNLSIRPPRDNKNRGTGAWDEPIVLISDDDEGDPVITSESRPRGTRSQPKRASVRAAAQEETIYTMDDDDFSPDEDGRDQFRGATNIQVYIPNGGP